MPTVYFNVKPNVLYIIALPAFNIEKKNTSLQSKVDSSKSNI